MVQHKVTSQTLLNRYGNFYEMVEHKKFHYCLYSLDRPTICPNVDISICLLMLLYYWNWRHMGHHTKKKNEKKRKEEGIFEIVAFFSTHIIT